MKHIRAYSFPWYQKWRGLLREKKARPIFFRTRWGIHTLGLRYPIDVVILDGQGIVQKVQSSLSPNRFLLWNPRFDGVLELPEGTIAKERIQRSDRLRIFPITSY